MLLCLATAMRGFGQTTATVAQPDSDAYVIAGSGNLTVDDPVAVSYLNFFGQVQNRSTSTLTPEAKVFLRLSDEEFRKLQNVTLDLATQSRWFAKEMASLVFESRMQIVESDAVSPAMPGKMRNLNERWQKAVLEHAQQLKAAIGEDRFRVVDDFVRSDKPLFETGWKPLVKLAGAPAK